MTVVRRKLNVECPGSASWKELPLFSGNNLLAISFFYYFCFFVRIIAWVICTFVWLIVLSSIATRSFSAFGSDLLNSSNAAPRITSAGQPAIRTRICMSSDTKTNDSDQWDAFALLQVWKFSKLLYTAFAYSWFAYFHNCKNAKHNQAEIYKERVQYIFMILLWESSIFLTESLVLSAEGAQPSKHV